MNELAGIYSLTFHWTALLRTPLVFWVSPFSDQAMRRPSILRHLANWSQRQIHTFRRSAQSTFHPYLLGRVLAARPSQQTHSPLTKCQLCLCSFLNLIVTQALCTKESPPCLYNEFSHLLDRIFLPDQSQLVLLFQMRKSRCLRL